MTASRRRHPQSHQAQLPFLPADGERRAGHDEEWRLDDQTRQIGRRGVALARARLAGSGGATERAGGRTDAGDRPGPNAGAGTDRRSRGRGPAGRAA